MKTQCFRKSILLLLHSLKHSVHEVLDISCSPWHCVLWRSHCSSQIPTNFGSRYLMWPPHSPKFHVQHRRDLPELPSCVLLMHYRRCCHGCCADVQRDHCSLKTSTIYAILTTGFCCEWLDPAGKSKRSTRLFLRDVLETTIRNCQLRLTRALVRQDEAFFPKLIMRRRFSTQGTKEAGCFPPLHLEE